MFHLGQKILSYEKSDISSIIDIYHMLYDDILRRMIIDNQPTHLPTVTYDYLLTHLRLPTNTPTMTYAIPPMITYIHN